MERSDYVFAAWIAIILIVAILTVTIPAWRDWLGLLLAGLVGSGLVALFRHCLGAEMEPE